ncbi:hypothetical protein AKJ16_DCAP17999 [Drosera capensis]
MVVFAASVLKEKFAALGLSGILADHQLQAQLQEPHLKRHFTWSLISSTKRIVFFILCHGLISLGYVMAFYADGLNLMAYNLCTGADNIYKWLYTSVPGNVEFYPKHVLYSKKQHLFLVVYEFDGSLNEVNFYWETTASHAANAKRTTVKGMASLTAQKRHSRSYPTMKACLICFFATLIPVQCGVLLRNWRRMEQTLS